MITITKKKWSVISVSILEGKARKYKFSVCESVQLCSFREACWRGRKAQIANTGSSGWSASSSAEVTLSKSLNFSAKCQQQHPPQKFPVRIKWGKCHEAPRAGSGGLLHPNFFLKASSGAGETPRSGGWRLSWSMGRSFSWLCYHFSTYIQRGRW